MPEIGFEFPPDLAQLWDGFNDSGIETFSGTPFRSVGKEGAQNTLDAAKEGLPARIIIRRIDVPTSSIPDVGELRTAIRRCKVSAPEEGSKAEQFFERADSILNRPTVSVLQISDSNTKGVRGPCQNGFPYFALMKATGQSKKDSGTAGGSYGIGKFAPYTVSGLRTVFVSTVWKDDFGTLHHYVQGKAILMSHHDETGKTFRGTGFWGIRDQCQPFIGQRDALPPWLARDVSGPNDTGTTLSILGFVPTPGWEKALAAGIAENFFGAIHRGDLVVEIEGGPTLNPSTLVGVFADQSVVDAIEDQKDEPETFQNSGHFLRALSSDESITEETENARLGHCRLHILVGEQLPKKVAVLRNGMLITSELSGLIRFSEFKEFAAVFECASDKGNALLRAMEPPAHNAFEPERLPTPQQTGNGRQALRELARWVRDMLKRHAQDPVAEVTEIDELAEFFGDDEGAGDNGSRDGDENPRGAIKVRARPLPKKKTATSSDEPGGTSEGDDGDGQEGDGDGEGEGPGEGGSGGGGTNNGTGGDSSKGGAGGGKSSSSPAIPLHNVRAVVLAPHRRRLAFTPDVGGNFRVELEDSGADTNRFLPIAGASAGQVDNGRLTVVCAPNNRVVIDVELTGPFEGTVRVKANAI